MVSVETLFTFSTASVLLALAPGPDNIFVLTQSSVFGRRAGFRVTLGLCTGLIVHSTAVALGVAVIFQKSAAAFAALKYIGAGYLVYLAWQAFHASAARIQTERRGEAKLFVLYRRGIIMNLTNPKVSIFFLAFPPAVRRSIKGAHIVTDSAAWRCVHSGNHCGFRQHRIPGGNTRPMASSVRPSSRHHEQSGGRRFFWPCPQTGHHEPVSKNTNHVSRRANPAVGRALSRLRALPLPGIL